MDTHKPCEDTAAQGEPATPDALRQIVARHQRARTRTLGIALAIVLGAGPLAGWAVGQSSGGGHQVVTASRPEPATDANRSKGGASGAAGAQAFAISGDPNGPKATRLFTRTSSDGIVIRAYRMD